jgi:hypothetical protein
MCHLIPTGSIDASLRALATRDHCEVCWFDEVERRWAVTADYHVVVKLENMTGTEERLHVFADKHLLPERMARMQRVGDPKNLSAPSLGSGFVAGSNIW